MTGSVLLKPGALINLIHEKFGVETFDFHSVSGTIDSRDPVVLLATSIVNLNSLALRAYEHIVLYACQLAVRFQFFGTINRFGAWREHLKDNTRRMQRIL